MQFIKLRLVGFKSFVEAQEFVIERGLTGVVGPNGCGKSNLVEALRWVMGENSYKNMRASGMDDVIFSGSAMRPARNSAEVTLFLDNSDYSAPIAFNTAEELQVVRRIERASGSLYRINGKEVRAKDVQLLFADQSTGARSPSMVGQGRIGELIQAKPQARRALLEEAAGISGLHSRRHEAELRLRAAETNLDRLEDVVGDLSSRIESLKRQARQANRFKSLSADIRQAESGVFYLRWTESKSHEAKAESVLNKATIRVAEQAQVHMRAQQAQENEKINLPSIREALAKALSTEQRLQLAYQQLEEEEKRNKQRHFDIKRLLEDLKTDKEREEQNVCDFEKMLEKLVLEEEELRLEAENHIENEEILAQKLEDLRQSLNDQEIEAESIALKRAEANAELTRIEHERKRLYTRKKKNEEESQAAIAHIRQLEDKKIQNGGIHEIIDALETVKKDYADSEEKVIQVEEKIEKARHEIAQATSNLHQCRDTLNAFLTEKRTLEDILESWTVGTFQPVIDNMKVEPGYENALGVALGDDLYASIEDDAPMIWSDHASFSKQDNPLPLDVKAMSHFVKAPIQLQASLSQIGVVDDKDGDRLQRQLAIGQCLVSVCGALWRWDGLKKRADAPNTAAQRLAQKNRLHFLDIAIVDEEKKLKQHEKHLDIKENVLEKALIEARNQRSHMRLIQEKRDEIQEYLLKKERQNHEWQLQLSALEDSVKRLKLDDTEIAAEIEIADKQYLSLPDIQLIEAALNKATEKLHEKRALVSEVHTQFHTLKQNSQARLRRFEKIEIERKNWLYRLENTNKQLERLAERYVQAMNESKQLINIPESFANKRQTILDEIATAQTKTHDMQDQLTRAENTQLLFDKRLREAFTMLSSLREERARDEERLNAAVDRRKDIETRIYEAMNCTPIETLQHSGLTLDKKMPEITVLEHKVERLRLERERLGAVNLRAEEEENALRSHLDAMMLERHDVLEAIKKLRLAIQNLNREGRERLLEAFHQVNQEFKRLFEHLFGGGTAKLQLIESDDPLNAGLEIIANPPGKKPQTMTLLSGGEQALTALALIFAVFLTNPAPICVLDEVDAPLDDHNVERYCNLMDEMAASTRTRFVVITHNPITMARMNRLFGVTMAEQGVSQLVSVDLQTAEQMSDTL
ncbi:chromosome segregation protein SMC [Bartonella tamiae]|uniref:Chromosome partition protein Smc n=1 Tax=Bartonella tamiae Th239 TaxID=1094558 RepID=J1K0K0_9HYPH|nr:chromosome segregation protein SMC [Bartonella tamiae]EJF90550.1 chromosome segregation protein SMC [Bartonella tamiae Th239]EJF94072.1 chromosome segregation protein SMC [Bartonella tamiae Th307]